MKINMAILAALWLSMSIALPTMADPVKQPGGTAVAEQPKKTHGADPAEPVAKKEAKPDTGTVKKQGAIDTEAELETDCNNQ